MEDAGRSRLLFAVQIYAFADGVLGVYMCATGFHVSLKWSQAAGMVNQDGPTKKRWKNARPKARLIGLNRDPQP